MRFKMTPLHAASSVIAGLVLGAMQGLLVQAWVSLTRDPTRDQLGDRGFGDWNAAGLLAVMCGGLALTWFFTVAFAVFTRVEYSVVWAVPATFVDAVIIASRRETIFTLDLMLAIVVLATLSAAIFLAMSFLPRATKARQVAP